MTHNLNEIININIFPKITYVFGECVNKGHSISYIINILRICKGCGKFACPHCISKNDEMCVNCHIQNGLLLCHNKNMIVRICYECKKMRSLCRNYNCVNFSSQFMRERERHTYCENCYLKFVKI